MRLGCAVSVIALMILGVAAGTIWMGRRILQEPEILANPGTPEDGRKGQQKIFEIARAESSRPRARPRRVVLSESELNGFLSRHLLEAAKIPVVTGVARLVGDGVVELKGQLPSRLVLPDWPLAISVDLLPRSWLERPVWLHLWVRASLEVGTARGQRKYLRLDVERFALGRQPIPETILRMLGNPSTLSLLRWRMPDSVEAITIEPGSVVVKLAS